MSDVVEKWMKPARMEKMAKEGRIPLGSRIDIQRPGYEHVVTFAGYNKRLESARVIGYDGDPGNSKNDMISILCSETKGTVYEKDLHVVANGSQCRVNRDLDYYWANKHNFSGEEIVRRAKCMLGRIDYHLIYFNCESFVNVCRYGDEFGYSMQMYKSSMFPSLYGIMARRILRWVSSQKQGCTVEQIQKGIQDRQNVLTK